MNRTKKISLAMIDDTSSAYTFYLYQALERFPLRLSFYGPKNAPIGKYLLNKEVKGLRKTWSSHLYPIQIAKAAAGEKPQLVHLQLEFNTFGSQDTAIFVPVLLLLLKFLGKRTVTTVHAIIPTYLVDDAFVSEIIPKQARLPSSISKIALILFYKTVSLMSDALIVHYETLRKWLTLNYRIDADKVYVIPHGVCDGKVKLGRGRHDFWSRYFRGSKVILFFGVLSPRKGLEYLIEAYSKIKTASKCCLVIAGEEPPNYPGYRAKLKKLSDDLGIENVVFTGLVRDDDIFALYEIADIVVLPYKVVFSASGPLSYAIQYEKPIIATNNQIFNEEFEGGETALLVQPGSVADLANAIETLLIDENLKREFARKIGERAKQKTWAKVAQSTFELYQELLNGTNESWRKPSQYGKR
jgi:glycosyltransferase involved in cell wall biosynthesis